MDHPVTIIIVSGGVGYSAGQLIRTALAQFPGRPVNILRAPQVRSSAQIAAAVAAAREHGALLAHMLVDPELRRELERQAAEQGLATLDLIGPALASIALHVGGEPLGQPGLFDAQNRSLYDRIAAIEYTLAHDDGAHMEEWGAADVIVCGVSRVGKTPLSIYLAVLGWKVANLPLVPELPVPPELLQGQRERVVGLTIGLEQLIEHRRWRQRRIGVMPDSPYASPRALSEELEQSDRLFRRAGIPVVDVTNKPLESIASEVVALIERRAAAPPPVRTSV